MNSFFGIGFMELFFIAVLALIVLGPERLPGAIREIAKHLRTVRQLSNELTSQFSEELQALDELNPQKIMRELTEDPAAEKKTAESKPKRNVTPTPNAQAMNKPASADKSKTNKAAGTSNVSDQNDGEETSTAAAAGVSAAAKAGKKTASSANIEADTPDESDTDAAASSPDSSPVENRIMPPDHQDEDAGTSGAQNAATASDHSDQSARNVENAPPASTTTDNAAGDSAQVPQEAEATDSTPISVNGVPDKPEDVA